MTAAYFLPGAAPDKAPDLPRRRAFVLLIAGAFGAGAAGLLFYVSKPAPLQLPGPRRYPRAYRR
jgi:hypothetical protein